MTAFPLYLMRHGEPALAGTLLGRTDCAVTTAGVAICAEQARELNFARLVTSDLIRARRCADAIGAPDVDPRWRELDFGDWDGLAADAVDAAALARFWEDPDAYPPPGGERWSSLAARIAAAIGALDAVPTLVVTHGGAMRAALHLLCGFDLARTWTFALPYGVVLGLSVWPGEPRSAQITGLWP